MNKLDRTLIFNAINNRELQGDLIDELIEIIEATPNERVCLELLCGVYEKPKISKTPKKLFFCDNLSSAVFVSYNKFTNKVTYNYHKEIEPDHTFIVEDNCDLNNWQ
jgi:hypothetical protein